MIVLDTNVLSELMRREPNPRVVAWLDVQPANELVITAICQLHGARLATRNVRDFEPFGVSIINPWTVSETG